MRAVAKLYERARHSKRSSSSKMGIVCRNYDRDKGGEWAFFIDGKPAERTEIYFPTQEAAVKYGETLLSDDDTLLVSNI